MRITAFTTKITINDKHKNKNIFLKNNPTSSLLHIYSCTQIILNYCENFRHENWFQAKESSGNLRFKAPVTPIEITKISSAQKTDQVAEIDPSTFENRQYFLKVNLPDISQQSTQTK